MSKDVPNQFLEIINKLLEIQLRTVDGLREGQELTKKLNDVLMAVSIDVAEGGDDGDDFIPSLDQDE